MPPDPDLIVPTPKQNEHDVEMWIDEQIWGHRIWDAQSPWLIFLEFLTVAEACHREGRLLDERGIFYPLVFRPYKRMFLRNILANYEGMIRIVDQYADSYTAWTKWLNLMEEKAVVVYPKDFSYLRKRFSSFQQFVSLVSILDSSLIESERNKRWSSRFVFPFGPNGLYEDLNPSGGREYIYFGRTGELLYLMLCRAAQSAELKPHLEKMFMTNNSWNTLLGLLQPGPDNELSMRGHSYLPYRQHTTFDRLGEDWLQIFNLQLPGFDAYAHLVTLGAFHILLYQLLLAAEWCQEDRPSLVCEVIAPKKTLVRELSSESYLRNNSLPARAVEAYIKQIENSVEWQEALTEYEAFTLCRRVLEEKVWWGEDLEEYVGASNPDDLLAGLKSAALKRHRQHVANIHRRYGGGVGLVSKRATNKLRYAPTDSLLKTLLLANVDHRMELSEFLAKLYTRYALVFGEREAELVVEPERYDKKAFQANARRLEQRLSSLGMLRRLSDGCAYVENPYGRRFV